MFQILEAGIECKEHSEVISTEDLLNQIDRLNKGWRESGTQIDQDEIFVGSLDAAALYPSLDVTRCSKMCGEMIRNSPVTFEGVDYEWASLYIALNTKPREITRWRMNSIIPSRRFTGGRPPGITGVKDPM